MIRPGRRFLLVTALVLLNVHHTVNAGEVRIIAADFHSKDNIHWNVNVTLQHTDAGWDHYADSWRVVDSDGNVLGNRILIHPHVEEQPFTRSLANVKISQDTAYVFIEAHDKVHGWSQDRLRVDLRRASTGKLRVERKN